MWDPAPDKYNTKCTIKDSNEVVFERVYEAISDDEAEARAFLNCVKENNNKTNINVEVKRL
jgi:hypothetical protein